MRSTKVHRIRIKETIGRAALMIKLAGLATALLVIQTPLIYAEDSSSDPVAPAAAPAPAPAAAVSEAVSEAKTEAQNEDSRWRPELGLGFILHIQDLEGSASANFMELGAPNSDQAISPGFRFSLGMSTPVLLPESSWKPRLFAHTGVQYLLEESYTAYRGFTPASVGFNNSGAAPNCDVPAWQKNVRGDETLNVASNFYDNTHLRENLPELWRQNLNTTTGGTNPENTLSEPYAQQRNDAGVNGSVSWPVNAPQPTISPPLQLDPANPAAPAPGFATGGFAIGGVDCTTNTKVTTSIDAMWFLGAGVEVTLPVLSKQFHVRASADYVGQSFGDVKASWDRQNSFDVCTNRGVFGSNQSCFPAVAGGGGTSLNRTKLNGRRLTASTTGDGFTTHALGTSVQIDVDVYKKGDLRLSLFLEMRVAWLLSQPESNLTLGVPQQNYNDQNCAANPGGPYHCDYLAGSGNPEVEFNIMPDEFMAQGGGGIRILWSPPW